MRINQYSSIQSLLLPCLLMLLLSLACQDNASTKLSPSTYSKDMMIGGDALLMDQSVEGDMKVAQEDQVLDQSLDQDIALEGLGSCELPDRVQIRRLSRFEYQKSLQSIFDRLADHVAQDLPEDGIGYGFDQIGEVLSTSPLHIEKYSAVLNHIFSVFYQSGLLIDVKVAKDLKQSQGASYRGTAWQYWSDAETGTSFTTYYPGTYLIRAKASNTNPTLALRSHELDDPEAVSMMEITADPPQWIDETWVWRVRLEGNQLVEAKLQLHAQNQMQRMLLEELQILGPIDLPPEQSLVREQVLPCRFHAKDDFIREELLWLIQNELGNQSPKPVFQDLSPQQEQEKNWQCLSQSTNRLAQLAWRRNLNTEDKNRLLSWLSEQIANGSTWEEAFTMVSQAIFLSPQFTFRVENPSRIELSDEEIASRMSYFLWSAPPDERLLNLAHQGELRIPQKRRELAEQMLNHPKAVALIDSFADQWLHMRNMKNVAPDMNNYPAFDEQLRHSMEIEAKLLFAELLARNATLDELLESKYRLIDQRLAQHYQLDWEALQAFNLHSQQPSNPMNFFDSYLYQEGFIKLDISQIEQAPQLRKGFLGIGAFLTISSMPTRTSPVKRGKWVLEQLLCSEPPPPPPNVEATLSNDDTGNTLREKLEQHRADPSCAGCHKLMDPIGLSLEKFDGIGQFREMDNGYPIDDHGELIDGTSFRGVEELSHVVKTDPRYHHCFLEKLYIFALGRGNQPNDRCILEQLEQKIAINQYRIKDFILAIIESDAFVMQKTEPIE